VTANRPPGRRVRTAHLASARRCACRKIGPPSFTTGREFLDNLWPGKHWRGGLPLWHCDSIFPEDFARLAQHRFDVLVTHEASSCHRHGFAAIDRLAEAAAGRLIVRGHRHEQYTARLANEIDVRGLGSAEPRVVRMARPCLRSTTVLT
jgi:hypothetical protein